MAATRTAQDSPTNLWVQEAVISVRDNDDRMMLGESGVYEAFTGDRGELYRSCLKEHGRCIGRVYIDRKGKPPAAIGWVFVARRPYEDDPSQSSLIETWVSVHTGPTTVTRTPHYAEEETSA